MANIIVDGFATYGTGIVNFGNGVAADQTAVAKAMLAGAWADVPNGNVGGDTLGFGAGIGTLPWSPTNTDLFIYRPCKGYFTVAVSPAPGFRRVFPVSVSTLVVSFYFALSKLPEDHYNIVEFLSSINGIRFILQCDSTGTLSVSRSANGAAQASTATTVMVAQTVMHLEMKYIVSTDTFTLYAGGVLVMTAVNVSGAVANVAQLGFLRTIDASVNLPGAVGYVGNLIIRDGTTTRNRDIIGDRRVATIVANADDVANQGWTPRYYKRFGGGILDTTAKVNTAVSAPSSTQTDLGTGDFTLETEVRFKSLPVAAAKAVIFGKWDEAANKRSYQLYLGGPALDSGKLTFRISTDGAAGTVSNIIQYTWQPLVGVWYNLTVTRTSDVLRVFVDGLQLGANVADTTTYYAGTELSVLGAQMTSTATVVADTSLTGWLDNFRLTVGVSRYSANFTPPSASFIIGNTDTNWASVAWLSTFDTVTVIDESSFARVLTKWNSAAAYAPLDGAGAYQTIGKYAPNDDTFISATRRSATGILTMTTQPTALTGIVVATTDGTTAAVYLWRSNVTTAFSVLIGATIADSLANMKAAINREAGEGTLYGTGTTANNDVIADLLLAGQLRVTALVPGTAGNSLASTTTASGSSWTGATLSGGGLPAYSQFYFSRLPSDVTTVDSITLVQRAWKLDAGATTTQVSFVGPAAGVLSGTARDTSTSPTLYFDTIEADPDVPANPLTPAAILAGRVRINRSV